MRIYCLQLRDAKIFNGSALVSAFIWSQSYLNSVVLPLFAGTAIRESAFYLVWFVAA